jgi:sugar phosphate isomerase/epimerase
MNTQMNRREFVTGTAAGLLCASLPLEAVPSTARPICTFEKPLLFLNNADLAETMATLGFTTIEAAVRKGGRVLPKNVANDLPRFQDDLRKRGVEITIIATDINTGDQPFDEMVLRTAAKLGIQRYRMMFYPYDARKPILPQLDAFAAKLPALVDLNRQLGLTAIYQIHSGMDRVGACVWDIYSLIKGFDPKAIGIGFDIQHATIEGGLSWPIQFKLVESHLAVVYVKDFVWEKSAVRDVPLGQGQVNHGKFFPLLRQTAFTGPICLHVEYLEGKENERAIKNAMAQDLATLRAWLET